MALCRCPQGANLLIWQWFRPTSFQPGQFRKNPRISCFWSRPRHKSIDYQTLGCTATLPRNLRGNTTQIPILHQREPWRSKPSHSFVWTAKYFVVRRPDCKIANYSFFNLQPYSLDKCSGKHFTKNIYLQLFQHYGRRSSATIANTGNTSLTRL